MTNFSLISSGRSSGSSLLCAFLSSTSRQTSFLPSHQHQKPSIHTTSSLSAKKYLLNYSYIPDVLEKRDPFREEHLQLAQTSTLGGPTNLPGSEIPSGALFVFDDMEAANAFAGKDPYVTNGIVTAWSITEWNEVIGN